MKEKFSQGWLSAKRLLLTCGGILFLVAILFLIFSFENNEFNYDENRLAYSEHRASPKYTIEKVPVNSTVNFETYKIIYESADFMKQGNKIHGLLYVPNTTLKTKPAMLFLPGGGVKKEEELAAPAIAEMGYVVLVIDQRGVGETAGFYPNFEQDKLLFDSGETAVQHLGVYDALRGIDVLKNFEGVDKNNVAIGGSSMGGRYAMMAAALDSGISKAVILSSSGFHIEGTSFKDDSYFLSIDADRYVKDIAPAKLIMMHSITDEVIKIENAEYTFSLANEPKSFYTVENCSHGYCEQMKQYLEEELKIN